MRAIRHMIFNHRPGSLYPGFSSSFRLIPILPAILIATALMLGCGAQQSKQQIQIVTTFLPLQDMVLDLTHDLPGITSSMLAPASGGCPNHYSMVPGDVAAIRKADIVVVHGMGLDSWMKREKVAETDSSQRWIVVSDTLTGILHHEAAGEDEHGHDHIHGALPHAWTSPDLAAMEIEYLARKLAKVIPEHADTLLTRSRLMADTLNTLFSEFKTLVETQNYPQIAVFHSSFNVLAERTGLGIAITLMPDPDTAPGPQETSKLISQLRDRTIAAVIAEPQIDSKFVAMIQKESGRTVYSLDPIVTGEPGTGLFISTIRENLLELEQALEETR